MQAGNRIRQHVRFHAAVIWYKQITAAPPPFPDHLRRIASGRRLEALILKALAKSPANRPKYMLELASELKGIESGDGGFWRDLKSMSSIVSGRLKAAERKTILSKVLLQATAVLAYLFAVLLFTLPGEINSAQQQLRRDEQIVDAVHSIFDFGTRKNDITKAAILVPKLRRLRDLCQPDPQQKAAYQDILESTQQAIHEWNGAKKGVLDNISSAGIGMGSLNKIEQSLLNVVLSWSESTLKGQKQIACTQQRIIEAKQKLRLRIDLLVLSKWSALICEILIAILLVKSWSLSRKIAGERKNKSLI